MNTLTELEKLCHPILIRVCNYWQLVSIGEQPTMEQFRQDIESLLEKAQKKAGNNPSLALEYAKIERPLIFFIDYMVKEGNFPFRNEWQELGRKYNELSGDEKFFNLLEESLDDPDADSVLRVYYLMLGLGFEGVYRSNHRYIEGCMKHCMERFSGDFDIHDEPFVKITSKRKGGLIKKKRFFRVHLVLFLSLVFMVLCFAVNFSVFMKTTSSYRQILSSTVLDAIPRSTTSLYQSPQPKNSTDSRTNQEK